MTNGLTGTALDVRTLALSAETIEGRTPLSAFSRLTGEMSKNESRAEPVVEWSAQGEARNPNGVAPEILMHLHASVDLPMTCQRCLGTVAVPIEVQRSYRFVADEQTASAEDDESEEDLLVLSRDFNLLELVEDELLMELPVVPKHDECPSQLLPAMLKGEAESDQLEERPHPFAILGQLRGNKSS